MSFLFNFSSAEEENFQVTHNVAESISKGDNEDDVSLLAFEVKDFYGDQVFYELRFKPFISGDVKFDIVDIKFVEEHLVNQKNVLDSSNPVLEAIHSHSDLVPGAYEGGLKIWECSSDLIQFLSSSENFIEIKGKSVLELGCGAGLPGLFCLKAGAHHVDFQDYNVDVLKLITHSNVRKNILSERCHYFAGDWSYFKLLAEEKNLRYDLILTSETIYNPLNYSKILDVIKTTLTDNGVVLLAAKTYYFGVGGSIDSFLDFVKSTNLFRTNTLLTIQEGVPRQIISLHRQTENNSPAEHK